MNIVESKEKLKAEGWCIFNLNQLNTTQYEYLSQSVLCNEASNIKESMHRLRGTYKLRTDFENKQIDTLFLTTSELEAEKATILNDSDEIRNLWASTNSRPPVPLSDRYSKRIVADISEYMLDLPSGSQDLSLTLDWNHWSEGCTTTQQSIYTGTDIRVTVYIVLNETYNGDNGGLIQINGQEVIPSFGDVIIIDDSVSRHSITPVQNGIGLFTMTGYIQHPKTNSN